MGKNKEKGKKKTSKTYSGIAAHKRQRKALVPPFMAIPGIKLSSWIKDRLPEMLWCALLISELGRDRRSMSLESRLRLFLSYRQPNGR
jgi:hypothetical protein